MQSAQTSVGGESRVYVIPSEAYGGKLRGGLRRLVLFAEYSSLMFAAQLLFDIFFAKGSVRSNLLANWTHDAFFSMFWGTGMAVIAAAKMQGLSKVEIGSDRLFCTKVKLSIRFMKSVESFPLQRFEA